jgi:rfaE bifunctional protein kinase chain/domain/rfaE bifunctional protein nucleotidyltransferase chain/domain
MSQEKILALTALAERARRLRAQGKRVVLCHGTFDLMHTGHIRYLQRARQEGDILLVTVTGDAFVNKGPGRPVFTEALRAESLAALCCVDYVAINYASSAVEALNLIQPSVYSKGSEYRQHSEDVTGNIGLEQAAVEAHGGEIFYTDELVFSSSTLLNEHFGVFNPETLAYLKQFKQRWSEKEVHQVIASLADLKVLVIGDAIIDQYHYTSPLGQTGKGSFLAVRYESEEQFAGGSLAVANHIASFVSEVTLVAGIGKVDSHEAFMREKLLPNVEPVFFTFETAPTVTKRRFVDTDVTKLFEVYFFKENAVSGETEKGICAWLRDHLAEFDAVVVPDFGNGFITADIVTTLEQHARFLAVNTQINSGNRGYHVITRYQRADFVSLNEPELRLAAHSRSDSLEKVSEQVGARVQAKQLAITRGTKGVLINDRVAQTMHTVPALSTKVVDRVGAGDAFLSLAALCAAKGLDAQLTAFIGSVAAAMGVQIVGNRDFVVRASLAKYVSSLLK